MATARVSRLAIVLALGSAACSRAGAVPDAGAEDGWAPAVDLCDAFIEVGAACPLASPVRCVPECDGGCFCRATPEGPRWACETDLSCLPDCAPIDEECGIIGPADDAGGGDSD